MLVNEVGWIAAALTLLTFSMREMRALRAAGMAANLAFIFYGLGATLYPVVALHMLLLPCNALRFWQIARERRGAQNLPLDRVIDRRPDEMTAG